MLRNKTVHQATQRGALSMTHQKHLFSEHWHVTYTVTYPFTQGRCCFPNMNPLTFGRARSVKIVCNGNTPASKWLRQIDYVTQTVRSVAVNNFTQWAGRVKSNPHLARDWIILLTYRLDIVAQTHCPRSSSNASNYFDHSTIFIVDSVHLKAHSYRALDTLQL